MWDRPRGGRPRADEPLDIERRLWPVLRTLRVSEGKPFEKRHAMRVSRLSGVLNLPRTDPKESLSRKADTSAWARDLARYLLDRRLVHLGLCDGYDARIYLREGRTAREVQQAIVVWYAARSLVEGTR
jgi:hypothetical protein